eukprot:tig00020614_g12168.t1
MRAFFALPADEKPGRVGTQRAPADGLRTSRARASTTATGGSRLAPERVYPHAFKDHASGEVTPAPAGHSGLELADWEDVDAGSPSLQVRFRGTGRWLPVAPVMGALFVVLGEMVQVLSNDRFCAAKLVSSAAAPQSRHCASFLYVRDPSAVVAPAPGSGPPLYEPIVWGELLLKRTAPEAGDDAEISWYRTDRTGEGEQRRPSRAGVPSTGSGPSQASPARSLGS